MSNMIDYLVWRGDVRMTCSPFNHVDNLILSEFSYLLLEKADQPCEGKSIREIAPLLAGHPDAFGYIDADSNREMMKQMASGDRFGDVLVRQYRHETDEDTEKQFAAMTFFLPDETAYIAFRGTDDSLVGWKEDFNMAFACPVPAQTEAMKYLQRFCRETSCPVRVGGHSKGGNLAVYAAANLEEDLQGWILQVYSNDGPGMLEATVTSEGYERISGKIVSILPEFSIIGMLMHQHKDYQVVSSTSSGLMQHNPFSWEVLGTGFVQLPKLKPTSMKIDTVIDQWLFDMPEEDRMQLVDALYSALKSTEIKTVEDLLANRLKTGISLLFAIRHFNHDTRQLVWDKLTRLVSVALKGEEAEQNGRV